MNVRRPLPSQLLHMATTKVILSDLTTAQREAVTCTEGPLLVVAGPGSGKTRVITRRVAYLAARGVAPYRILAVTFTNKAAGEMRERIEALAGTSGAWVSTFHSLCAAMLRISAEQLGIPQNFSIYDRDDQLRLIRQVKKDLEPAGAELSPSDLLNHISRAKQRLETPQEFAASALSFKDEFVAKAYNLYQRRLEDNAAMDFDDLLMRVALFLGSNEDFRQRWQRRFRYILVDEYQDTNEAQDLIARTLAEQHRNICATGDPDQSIYGWRGASIHNILRFQEHYPDARVVHLEENYRSTATILRAADSLISHNNLRHERGLWTRNPRGTPIKVIEAPDADDEAEMVAKIIEERLADGARPRDFAIFYRTNAQSRAFEIVFTRRNIPFRLVGAVQFCARREIKDLVAYLRFIVNERDDLSLARIINVPPRGIGATTLERLRKWAQAHRKHLWEAVLNAPQIEQLGTRAARALERFATLINSLRQMPRKPAAAICEKLLKASGYLDWMTQTGGPERKENIEEFLAWASGFDDEQPEGGLEGFLQQVGLVSDVDNLDPAADAVALMTLHAAKGLEFPVVFLTGLEDGLLPHANSSATPEGLEEERRLCFVGITRAKHLLFLTHAGSRQRGGSVEYALPSRFLLEIDPDTLDAPPPQTTVEPTPDDAPDHTYDEPPPEEFAVPEPPPARRPRRLRLRTGDRIRHPHFGLGTVLAVQDFGRETFATISFDAGGKRILSLRHAPLERLSQPG